MKILITGAKGTLGKILMAELKARGHSVFGCDMSHGEDVNYARCNVAEYRQILNILEEGYDVVYHLAAEFGRINGEHYYEQLWNNNVIATRHILEIQKKLRFRMVMASSSEIYGDIKADFLKEDMKPEPQLNDYAISKWVNEVQCRNFIKRHNNQIMVLRFFNAYGPGEFYSPYRSVVCLFCYRALHGLSYDVYDNYHRVFMYMDDFIPTLANCCTNFHAGEIINIGGEEYRPVKDVSDLILKNLGMNDRIVRYLPEDKHNLTNKRPDITKAKALLNHDPKIKLEEGIIKTIEWMKGVYKC